MTTLETMKRQYSDGKRGSDTMRFIYPAVIRQTGEREFHAVFPDLNGCEARGDSLDDCIRNCNLEAYDWIDLEMHEEEPDIPGATDLDELEELYGSEEHTVIRNILTIYRMREGWDE